MPSPNVCMLVHSRHKHTMKSCLKICQERLFEEAQDLPILPSGLFYPHKFDEKDYSKNKDYLKKLRIYPFLSCGLFYPLKLDESFHHLGGVRFIFVILIEFAVNFDANGVDAYMYICMYV